MPLYRKGFLFFFDNVRNVEVRIINSYEPHLREIPPLKKL